MALGHKKYTLRGEPTAKTVEDINAEFDNVFANLRTLEKLLAPVAVRFGGTGKGNKTEGFDNLAPGSTKGDLIVHNGADNIRLAVGTNGQGVRANSGATPGVAWADETVSAVRASQPTAANALAGTLAFITDENIVERSSGSAWAQFGPFIASPLTLAQPGIKTISPIHVVAETRGLVDGNLAPSQYVFIGESEDAIIGLASEDEGWHGSGIDLMEVDAGTLADKWFVGRLTSTEDSDFVWYYGTDEDYGANTRYLTLSKSGVLVFGPATSGDAKLSTNPALKRSSAELHFRLGDDSANATIQSGLHKIQVEGSDPTFATWVTAGDPPLVTFAETTSGNGDHLFCMAADSNTSRPVFLIRRSRGTLANPTAVQAGTIIGSFLASGRSANGAFQNTAAIEFAIASGATVSGDNVPTGITFVTGQTSGGRTTKLAITHDGLLMLGSINGGSGVPALKPSSTTIEARLGDDSAYTSFRASAIGVGIAPDSSNLLNIASDTVSPKVRIANQRNVQFSNASFTLVNDEVASGHEEWVFFAEKASAGAATGGSSFQIRRRNATQSEATTHFVVGATGHMFLNTGFTAGSGSTIQGNVGVRVSNSGITPATALTLGAAEGYSWEGRSEVYSPSNGVITLVNAAESDFGRLQFGGTTSSFPALKRSSAELQARLADDSGYANFGAAVFSSGGTAGITTTFVDADGNTITVTGGIITAKTAP